MKEVGESAKTLICTVKSGNFNINHKLLKWFI